MKLFRTTENLNTAAKNVIEKDFLTRWLTFAGAAILIACAFLPWFRLPQVTGSFGGIRFPTTSIFQLPYQVMSALVGITCFVMWWNTEWQKRISWLALGWLLLVGLFPYEVMLWDRQAAYVATELQSTNNLLVNETLLSIPDQMRSWKRNSQMLPMPRQIEVMQFSIPNVEYIAVANLDTSIIGFGYSNEFLDFMGSAYPLAWAACILLLAAAYLAPGVFRLGLFRSQAGVFCLAASTLVALAAIPICVCNYLLREAEVLSAQGLYAHALRSLSNAAKWLPVSALNSHYHEQLGEIRYQLLDRDSPDFYIYLGNVHFDAKQYEQAQLDYREALRLAPNDPIALHSLSATLTNLAINQFAQGRFGDAVASWNSALRFEPINLKAIYEIQIGYLQVANLGGANDNARQLLQILKTYRLPSITVIGQAYVHLSWCAYEMGEYEKAFRFYRRTVEPTLW